ncbi:target of Nesh-SH3 [Phaenicophaeus curvirostris]|uniref:target of Nesh-SH3 n=1 Tax=Phaenicophaeus curvirostris TaxID=33595 RepID=UPI0037F0F483
MMSRLVFLLFCGYIALRLGNAQNLPRVKRQSLKVQINATDDTVCMRYLRPSQNTKLEGFVLGYGSSFFSNQYIPLPSEGKTSITELDAEPRYLVSIRPARTSNNKKSCSGRAKTQKPLQLVVGTLTPTSVFLSWGILVNPQHDWTSTSNCANDRFYTVRYREKGKDKKWVFQLCPVTETVVDNLKPNTLYEFGVKDNLDDSIWSKTFNHKTVLSNKKVNGQLQNMYKLIPNAQTQLTLRDNKKLVPVTIIKQVIQNRTQSKTISDSSSLPGAILVHLIVPGLNETQQKLPPLLTIDNIPQASRKKLAKNETQVWPAESKTPEVQEISPQSLPAQAEKKHGPQELKSTPKPELVQTQNILASNEIQPVPSGFRISDAPKRPLTELATQSPALKSLPSAETREMEMAFEETQPVSSGSKTSGATEVQPTSCASHDFHHVTSTALTFTASEIPDTAGGTAEWEISMPISTTEPQLLETMLDLGEKKPLSSRSTTPGMPEMPPISAATQRPDLETTLSTSLETTRTVKATRKPRRKSTTPSSLATQQTVMVATQRPDLDSTLSASLETTRTVKATRKPRRKSTTPSSLATQQTVMVATQRPDLDSTLSASLETTRTVKATRKPRRKSTTPSSLATQQTVMATQRPDLETTLSASLETTRTVKATRKPRRKSTTPSSLATQQTVMVATQRPDLDSTLSASLETTRTVKATRKPRRKSTTPSSLATQQTVMASHDFTSTLQTPTSAKLSEQEIVIFQAPFKPFTSDNREAELDTDETQPFSSRSTIFAIPEMPSTKSATQGPSLKFTTHTSTETRRSMMAFDEKQHISSTSETSNIQEMLSAVPATQRPDLDSTLSTSLETTRTVKATRKPRRKSTTPSSLATQQTVMVTSSADLEKSMTPLSRTPYVLTTTIALSGIQPVLSSPVTPTKPETADAGPATSESILESFTPKTSRPFQWPRVTLAPKEIPLIPSKVKPSATPELPHVKPVPKSPLLEPKASQTAEQPIATLAPKEAKPTPSASKPRPPARTKKPRTKPAATIPVSVTTRSPYTYEHPKTAEVSELITVRIEQPRSTIAPKETQRFHSKPKTSPKPHIPQANDVLESITLRTDQLKPTIVPKETQRVPSKHRISPSSEVPQTKPVLEPFTFRTEKPRSTVAPKDTRHGPSKPKTSPSPHVPSTRASPKESRRVPSKPRASPSPDVPYTKPVLAPTTFTVEQPKTATAPKEPQHTPFKPKTAATPDAPQSKPEIIPTFHEPDTTMIPHIPERTKATLAPTEKQFIHTKLKPYEKPRVPHTKPAIHQTTPQPIITKSSATEHSRATMAPKETLLIPSKPKTSVGPELPQTKPAPKATHLGSINLITVHVVDGSKMTLVPNETYQISPKPKAPLATEIPRFHTAPHKTRLTSARPKPSDRSQTRPALSKTTVAPARTIAPGLQKWIVPTDEVYTYEDVDRQIDMDVKKPFEYRDTWEKPFSVTTPPGPQRPPIPAVKPTQMRRKPLPPNTVTGKPGSPAKPAGPTSPVGTRTSYKTPTAFATPEYYVDATVFSSSPTSETDSSGKPRYQAPHVKYMTKDEDVPCSITSSLEHFPQEEVANKEEPTRPPQNPPTNLTVVTVEGCPTFVILDWEKPENDTVTEYEVVSTENGASDGEKEKSIITTNQTHSTVENLKPDTSYEFHVKPRNPLGEGPSSNVVAFSTESADPRVSEPISMGKDAIWTEIPFNSDTYSECKGKQYVKRTWYKKFVGVQLCNSLRYKIYLSDSLTGKFYNIGDQRGHGEDHCQFVDSFLDGRTGQQEDLPIKDGFFRAVRQEPVKFGKIGGETHINYVRWYECGTSIPGKW